MTKKDQGDLLAPPAAPSVKSEPVKPAQGLMQAWAIQQEALGDGALLLWTITKNPADYPGKFVVCPHKVGRGVQEPLDFRMVADTLESIELTMQQMNLTRMTRSPGDDSAIVCVWF
jgi:hypothetical protein